MLPGHDRGAVKGLRIGLGQGSDDLLIREDVGVLPAENPAPDDGEPVLESAVDEQVPVIGVLDGDGVRGAVEDRSEQSGVLPHGPLGPPLPVAGAVPPVVIGQDGG